MQQQKFPSTLLMHDSTINYLNGEGYKLGKNKKKQLPHSVF